MAEKIFKYIFKYIFQRKIEIINENLYIYEYEIGLFTGKSFYRIPKIYREMERTGTLYHGKRYLPVKTLVYLDGSVNPDLH